MPDNRVYVIENAIHAECKNCGGIHDYISRPSDNAKCGTPLGASFDMAQNLADAMGIDRSAVVPAKDDMVVVLDNSARKLPRDAEAVTLDQISGTRERLM